ncbi:hypothetical protein E1B28_001641 [Marasmius oreades]|uniref:Uncharacterized protein n=1 Tax=Marasmius oreades TaxID=181124 RepID=A0A9P7V3W6_9AGAR|nr:uncharacterized protein E1B28_001641 [Marasmius oreades]KAG7099833.1 hypothetical protein E1B28_001641 [Marasmius oreades]
MESSTSPIPWNETPLGQTITYLPVLGSFLWRSFLLISGVLLYPITYLSALKVPLLAPISIFLYVFAPFLVFTRIILDLFVFTPYSTFVYLVDAIYPVYVFCGVACITGVLMGTLGRFLAQWATMVVMGLTDQKKEADQESYREEIEGAKVEYGP